MRIHKTNKVMIVLVMSVIIIFVAFFTREKSSTPNQAETHESETIISGSFDKAQLRSDEEWEELLTAEQYHILREKGTETPFTGILDQETRKGTYYSVGCDQPVFRSEQKYDSGTGWPSFWDPISDDALVLSKDTSLLGERIEVMDECGGHLGHVFDDGPDPTGKRYCTNSTALYFVPDED